MEGYCCCAAKINRRVRIDSELVRQALAEFLGTFVLVVFGDGSVAQSVLSRGQNGQQLSVHLCWGLAVSLAVYISGHISGGHINPAISLAACILKRLPWHKLPVYLLSQYLGAFVGAAFVYAVYYDAINQFDSGAKLINSTAGIFATYPSSDFELTARGAFVDQIFGTFLLALCVMAITDRSNANVPEQLVPPLLGSVVAVIGLSYGYNCGYAINPARDFAPRLFTAAAGWTADVFRYNNYYFWIPIVGPHLGAILGALVYQLLIGCHWPLT